MVHEMRDNSTGGGGHILTLGSSVAPFPFPFPFPFVLICHAVAVENPARGAEAIV